MYCYTLPIFGTFCSFITLLSFGCFTYFFVAASHRIPHSRIFRSRQHSPTEIIKCIVVHILEFICLTQSVPSSKILWVNFDSITICLNGAGNVFHFEILVAHKSPGCQTRPIELQGLSEVYYRLQMLAHQRIVVTDNTASLRVILVIIELPKCQIG